MIKVGDVVRLSEDYSKIPKGTKVRYMAKIDFSPDWQYENKSYGAVVAYHRGSEWRFSDKNRFSILEMSDELSDDTKITFISYNKLEPIDENDDRMILWNLAHKWNVRETDWYNNWRKEYKEKYGRDPFI